MGLPTTMFCTSLVITLTGMSIALPEPRRYGAPCDPNRGCDFSYYPICGSDGNTYANPCVFENEQCNNRDLKIEYDGECRTRRKRCANTCSFKDEPVCGSDGRTYLNECLLNSQKSCSDPSLTKVSDGRCPRANLKCSDGCFEIYAPVCGSNGITYSNDCELESASCKDPSITKAHDGECRTNNECPQFCPEIYSPVCGNDGKTYGNDCELNQAACVDPSIKKISDRKCECSKPCIEIYSPVCGSDGITYSNECKLDRAICDNLSITKVSDGPCRSRRQIRSCDFVCPAIYDPVCGSNGRTYGNSCSLSIAACRDPSIREVSKGECGSPNLGTSCDFACPAIYDPVCGSNGRTYGSSCSLSLAACRDPSIREVGKGECGSQSSFF